MADISMPPRLPIEEVAVTPAPGMKVPQSFSFSQDDTQVTYLLAAGENAAQQLYALDVATGVSSVLVAPPGGGVKEDQLSPEEELRRQRERSLATGLTHYSRAKQTDRLLIPVRGNLYVKDAPQEPLRLVVENAGKPPALTPMLSPDGAWIAYVQDAEVYVVSATGGAPRQITTGSRGTGKTHGLAEYIAQEELARSEGFWWSPDGASIAFTEVDETHIPLYRILHQGKDTTGEEAEEAHRYPFAGAANALVRLAVVAVEGDEPVPPASSRTVLGQGGTPAWMDLDFGEEVYLARVFWWKDGSLGAITLNREQSRLHLSRFDTRTGQRASVLEEESAAWINLGRKRLTLLERGGFLWTSERSGFRHIYLYGPDDTLVRQITDGAWV